MLPLGCATDLTVLEHLGSTVAYHGDHLVVRTSENAHFHWHNCIFVTDADALDDAARWVDAFEAAVPGADWIAIGLPRMPANVQGWTRCGIDLVAPTVQAYRGPRPTASLASNP